MKIVELLKELVGNERKVTVEILRALQETEDQRAYAIYGCSSIFKLCTRELHYSEGAAYRRVSAMRLIRRIGDAAAKIESGELSLTNAAKLETAFRVAELRSVEVNAQGLFESFLDITCKEADRKLEDLGLRLEGKFSAAIEDRIEVLRVLVQDPQASREELILLALDEAIAGRKPTPGDIAKEVRSPEKRHVPEKLKAAILWQANHTCSFVSPITGQRCDAKHYLELDHVVPFAFGGKTEAKNLRLLCRTHNLLAAREAGLGWRKN